MSEPFQPHTPWELGVKREINALQDRLDALEAAPARGEGVWRERALDALDTLKVANDNCERLERERDAAYQDNAVLSEQRDEACRLLDGEQRNHNVTIKRFRDVTAERDDARRLCNERTQQNAEARAALAKYGAHPGSCNWWTRNNANCTCGLDQAMADPQADGEAGS